jgi:hypothetical protein
MSILFALALGCIATAAAMPLLLRGFAPALARRA